VSEGRKENVLVPVGLIEELMEWCSTELEWAQKGTQYHADLMFLHDELLVAKEGY